MGEVRDLLDGKNALVTGAGRNIGRAIACEMAAQGASVYFTDLDERMVKKLGADLTGAGLAARGFVSDIRNQKAIDLLCDELDREGVSIDILVNNVGTEGAGFRMDVDPLDRENLRDLFDTNLFGPVELTRHVVNDMSRSRRGGSLIFITSIHQWVIRGIPGYSASKGAIGMLVKELAMKLAPNGIRVNGIAPGYVALGSKGKPVKHPFSPLHGTTIDPQYIGRAAVYLGSDYFSRHTTGSILKVDGGLSLYSHITSQFPNLS